MARDRLCFLERHGHRCPVNTIRWRPLLSRYAPHVGLVSFRQTFVCRCQNGVAWVQLITGAREGGCGLTHPRSLDELTQLWTL